jgi:hypothetical protein
VALEPVYHRINEGRMQILRASEPSQRSDYFDLGQL